MVQASTRNDPASTVGEFPEMRCRTELRTISITLTDIVIAMMSVASVS